jgi:hypothetical protein
MDWQGENRHLHQQAQGGYNIIATIVVIIIIITVIIIIIHIHLIVTSGTLVDHLVCYVCDSFMFTMATLMMFVVSMCE